MNIQLPPLFFYAIGALLTVFGTLRVVVLGRRRAERELAEDTPEKAKLRRYHRIWGVVWTLAGLVLIAMTAGVLGVRH